MDSREKLLRLMEGKNVSRSAIAMAVGVAYSTFRSYLEIKNRRAPSADVGVRIADSLGVPAGWLWNDRLDWPPPAELAPNGIPDAQLIAEIARRRHMIRQDMAAIAERLREGGLIDRVAGIATRAMHAQDSIAEQDLVDLRAAVRDLRQLNDLRRRLDWLDPDTAHPPRDEPPSGRDLALDFPDLLYALEFEEASNPPQKPPDQADNTARSPRAAPFSEGGGAIVSRDVYAGMGIFQQRGYVPILDDPAGGPPSEKPLSIYRGQVPPERFQHFVRYDIASPGAFAWRVDDQNMQPDIMPGSIVVCDPLASEQPAGRPRLVIFDHGRRHGIYYLGPKTLRSRNSKEFKAIRLKPGDPVQSYPIVAIFSPGEVSLGERRPQGRQ